MTANPHLLPSFRNPPVIETVLGVFFRPIRKLNSIQQGIFWNAALRSDFPEFELLPPVDEMGERFDGDSPLIQAGIRWQVSSEPDTPRLWAKSPSGEHILQVQRNAILANWLRRKDYRPFADRLADFEMRLRQFGEFARHELQEQELLPTSCTVTYINQIPMEQDETWAACATRALNCLSNPSADWLPAVDRGRLQFSFAFPESPGRLHLTAIPARHEQGSGLALRLELTARIVLPKEHQTLEVVSDRVRLAHDWVVRGFATVTRPAMHENWGRTQ